MKTKTENDGLIVFQKKSKQGGRVEDMEFPGVLNKEQVQIPEVD